VKELGKGKTIIKGTITLGNVYILGGKGHHFLSKFEENWLWPKILGHLILSQLYKSSKKGVVRDMPYMVPPKNSI